MGPRTKQTLRTVAGWVLPPRVEDVLTHTYGRWLMKNGKRNRALRNLHKGIERCFIIGNGPSLKTHDITCLRDEVVIVANSFYMHPDKSVVAPEYCCIGDHRFMYDEPRNIEWFREMELALPAAKFFVQSSAEPLFQKYNLFKGREVYFRNRGFAAHHVGQVELDLTRPTTVGVSTVSAMAIPLAIYLGFTRIYLVGCDANWLADLKGGASHFYKKSKFFPEYDRGCVNAEEIESEIIHVHRDFKSHRLLRARAETIGVDIINATSGGWLEMYPRVTFESLF